MGHPPFISDVSPAQTSVQERYAIIISGDGLKTTLATALSHRLAVKGITTARVKALSYFWSARSPERMSKDLEHQLRRRLKRQPNNRFLLIGYSFGAGTLPFAVNRLPPDLLSRVDRVVLMAPPADTDFEFFFRSWFNQSSKHARPTAPEIERLSARIPILYMRGETDFIGPSDILEPHKDLCLLNLPGGHDFNKDYDTLVDLILAPLPTVDGKLRLSPQ